MIAEHKPLVKESWARILLKQETAAELFYNRLFDQYPEVKPYFKGDIKEQGQKLMAMINTAVVGLDNLDALVDTLKMSGKAHREYGVRKEDYDKVGAALLWTLEQGLGDGFTPDIEEAWAATYTSLANAMINGAEYSV